MIIKSWIFEIIALILLAILVISGVWVVKKTYHMPFKIDSSGVGATQEARGCPNCGIKSFVREGLEWRCGGCGEKYDWNDL